MNAAIRGVVRAAIYRNVEVIGFLHGWEGVIQNETQILDSKAVGGIIDRGGTILRSARSAEFRTPEGRLKALENLKSNDIEGLVVIGGDGSLTGALKLQEEFQFPVMGVPGSIDNDISGTDYSIGFDTAVNISVEAIDRLRDTAYSHERVFVVEVMGRRNGFIAIESGLAGGAEAILIPEVPYSLLDICKNLRSAADRGKKSSIIVVAEGAARASDVKVFIEKNTGFDCRYLVLGHLQRGGSPTVLRACSAAPGFHAGPAPSGRSGRRFAGGCAVRSGRSSRGNGRSNLPLRRSACGCGAERVPGAWWCARSRHSST